MSFELNYLSSPILPSLESPGIILLLVRTTKELAKTITNILI